MRKTMGGFAAAVLVAVPIGLLAAPAGAQPYPPGSCSLTLSVSVVTPGQQVTVAVGAECSAPYAANTPVDLALLSDPVHLTTVTTGADGRFSTPITIPGDTPLGQHTVRSTGEGVSGSTLTLEAPITVQGGPAAGTAGSNRSGGQLAFTGGWVLALIAAALVCLTTGTALMVGARRRAEVRRQFS